jgi:Predicted dehydrogenases and related proteins
MAKDKLRVGIVGCGGIAKQKHLPALKHQADLADMVAFCDIVSERAEQAAKDYGAPGAKTYSDYKKLLEDPSIDIIHVLTPNVSHSPITVDALESGKHVMCEKPMAHSYADAKKMLDASKRTGKKLSIGYQNRFRSEVQALRKAVDSGFLGDVYFAKAHAVRRRAVPTWGVFPNKALQGGGPLIDIGTHALDLTLWMMGNYEPKSVTGSVFWKMADQFEGNLFGPWDPKTYEVEDSAFGFIKMANGATIFLESSWVLNTTDVKEACTTLCGTKGGAELKPGEAGKPPRLLLNTAKYGKLVDEEVLGGGSVAYFSGASSDPGDLEARQWLKAVLGEGAPLVKPEEALVVTRILEAIYKSNELGKPVEF